MNPRDPKSSVMFFPLLILCVAGPLVFGVPVRIYGGGSDSNFALSLVHGYTFAVRHGVWFPRWLPNAYHGFGSPVFYFYGRLPFLVAAFFAAVLRFPEDYAMAMAMLVFRTLAFFTCRQWLRQQTGRQAANYGALTFVALPFAMMFNPVSRVGFAEVAATAFIPLLFFAVDQPASTAAQRCKMVAILAIVYAALAATHLPQTLLGCMVVSLYGLVLYGVGSLLLNVAGACLGLFLSAPNVFPALKMQSLISPSGWTIYSQLDVRNNFLFTNWHLGIASVYLQSTWLLCFAAAVVALCLRPQRRVVALAITSIVSLLAMTRLFQPFWVYVPHLNTIQFPWRLFPAVLAMTGALVALLISFYPRSSRLAYFTIGLMVLGQMVLVCVGAYLSLSHTRYRASDAILYRVPDYARPGSRLESVDALHCAEAPEYISANASLAGWRIGEGCSGIVSPDAVHDAPPLPASLQLSHLPNGDLQVQGYAASPVIADLPTFYFEDIRSQGTASAVSLDANTGLARISIQPGSVRLVVSHDASVPSVRRSWVASSLAGLLCLALFWFPLGMRRKELSGTLAALGKAR